MDEFEKICREVWGAYLYLRANDLSAHSGTSKRLRSGDLGKLQARLLEELKELQGVVEGTHFHEGFDQDIVLEGYEVWYWAACLAIAAGFSYDELEPHRAFEQGFRQPPASRLALLPAFDALIAALSQAEAGQVGREKLAQVFRLTGQACSLNRTPPLRLLERDRSEMRQKEYLAAYWQAVAGR